MGNKVDYQFINAAFYGKIDEVKGLLGVVSSVDAIDRFGDTALNKACTEGHLEVVKILLDNGANPHNLGGAAMTPLMNAATAGHPEIAKLLIEKGASISDDLLFSIQLKANILEENTEAGMVRPEVVSAWKEFFAYLVAERKKQDNL